MKLIFSTTIKGLKILKLFFSISKYLILASISLFADNDLTSIPFTAVYWKELTRSYDSQDELRIS